MLYVPSLCVLLLLLLWLYVTAVAGTTDLHTLLLQAAAVCTMLYAAYV
jgi:hypothetical protein